jgi:hypothetical protein
MGYSAIRRSSSSIVSTDILKDCIIPIFRIKQQAKKKPANRLLPAPAELTLQP